MCAKRPAALLEGLLRDVPRADTADMVWLFARGAERLRCETRDGDTGSHHLAVTMPDGVERVEQYPDSAALIRRQCELVEAWKAQGWRELKAQATPVSRARKR